MAGDFNEIFCSSKKVGRSATFIFTGFGQWIQRNGMDDVGYIGQQHTWSQGENNNIVTKVRLDRGLANINWRSTFPKATSTHLPRLNSDHAPLLNLDTTHIPRANLKPFRFQAF